MPPRPSLLVGKAGDIEACRSSWEQLEPAAVDVLSRARAGLANTEELDNIARRFRSLRESLVAAYVRDDFAIKVYELSADVSVAAGCWPEFIKAVSSLTYELYPVRAQPVEPSCVVAESGQGASRAGDCSSSGRGLPGAVAPSVARHGTGVRGGSQVIAHDRRAEMCAAHCLFLACGPGGRRAEAVAFLRSPHIQHVLGSEAMTFTIKVLTAVALGDCHGFLLLCVTAPYANLRAILESRVAQVRTAAVRCLASAYRSLPASVAITMLRLSDTVRHCDAGDMKIGSKADGSGSNNASGASGGGGTEFAWDDESCTRDPDLAGASKQFTHSTQNASSALVAVLSAAAAQGVKGATVALEGLSAWEVDTGGSLGDKELVFRS